MVHALGPFTDCFGGEMILLVNLQRDEEHSFVSHDGYPDFLYPDGYTIVWHFATTSPNVFEITMLDFQVSYSHYTNHYV